MGRVLLGAGGHNSSSPTKASRATKLPPHWACNFLRNYWTSIFVRKWPNIMLFLKISFLLVARYSLVGEFKIYHKISVVLFF